LYAIPCFDAQEENTMATAARIEMKRMMFFMMCLFRLVGVDEMHTRGVDHFQCEDVRMNNHS
jgi:hypothetical protein